MGGFGNSRPDWSDFSLAEIAQHLHREREYQIFRKRVPRKRDEVRAIFEERPYGMLERLVTRQLLEAVQRIARRELDSENWIPLAERVGGRSHEEMRVLVLEFLDTDMDSLRLAVILNRSLVAEPHRTFSFVERKPADERAVEPGLAEFLDDPQVDDPVTENEIRLFRCPRFGRKRPTKLYYYRAPIRVADALLEHEVLDAEQIAARARGESLTMKLA